MTTVTAVTAVSPPAALATLPALALVVAVIDSAFVAVGHGRMVATFIVRRNKLAKDERRFQPAGDATIANGMAKKRSTQLDQEIREALAQIPRKPSLKTRAQLDAEIDAILAGGLPAERYEVAQALGFRYPKKAPPKKMTLTGTNLFALKEMVVEHGGPQFPSRMAAVDAPHIRRTVELGLAEPANGGTRLRLTEAGRDLVEREIEKDLAREQSYEPRVSSVVKPELRDEVLARERAKQAAKIDKLGRALAALRR